MTKKEAQLIGYILGTADGGCDTCANELAKKMAIVFPNYDWKGYVDEYFEMCKKTTDVIYSENWNGEDWRYGSIDIRKKIDFCNSVIDEKYPKDEGYVDVYTGEYEEE